MRHFFVLITLIILTFSVKLKAQEAKSSRARTEYSDSELMDLLKTDKKPQEEIKSPYQDLILSSRDAETGIVLEGHPISKDKNRYSLLYHVNANLKEPTELSSFEFLYARNFGASWLELSIAKTSATFDEVTNANVAATKSLSQELVDTTSDLFTMAAGLSYRTALIQNLINSDSFFETTSARLAYASFTDQFSSVKYAGYGLQAALGIHKRTSRRFHMGGVLSYNLIPVKRESEFEGETSSARSLLLNWLSLAVDLSFYF